MSFVIRNNNEKDGQNIRTLQCRKRGDIYYSDDGLLRKMTCLQKIFFLLLSKFFNIDYYRKVQRDVKNVISDLVKRIDRGSEKDLQKLFFKKLMPISEEIYDRSQINPKVLETLRKLLLQSSDCESLLREQSCKESFLFFFNRLFFQNKIKLENARRMKNVLLEAKLAMNLGIRPSRPNVGNSISYFVKNVYGKNIAIFKPAFGDSLSVETPYWPLRIRNRVLNLIGFGGSIFKHLGGYGYVAEKACYVMDESIQTNIVPPTEIVKFDPKRWQRKKASLQKGSMQVFVPNTIDASKFLGVHKRYKQVDMVSKEVQLSNELFDFVVIKQVMGEDFDGHLENWLIVPDEKNPYIVKDVALIDGAMSFSPAHVTCAVEKRRLYMWAQPFFKWARKRFSPKAKKIIENIYKKRFELKDELIELYISEGDDPEIAEKRGKTMVERIEMLYQVAIVKDIRKYELKYYKTQEEIDELLGSKN
jgi:hypothetical protein